MSIIVSAARTFACDAEVIWENLTHPPTLNRLNWRGTYGPIVTNPASGQRSIQHRMDREEPTQMPVIHWEPPDDPFTHARFAIGPDSSEWHHDFKLSPHADGVEVVCSQWCPDLNSFEKMLFEDEAAAPGYRERRLWSYQEYSECTMECLVYMIHRYHKHGLYKPEL